VTFNNISIVIVGDI